MQNNPDLSFKTAILNTLWEELEVKAEENTKLEVDKVLEQMNKPRRIYSQSIIKGKAPKQKNYTMLYNLTKKYNSLLRKESHRQMNLKKEDKNA